ncbi:MAG: DUF1624 domain-containing protein [Anaerolineales bacterium]|nr:DUF1624 domain-containing protein [Anaerolineales bacterium]
MSGTREETVRQAVSPKGSRLQPVDALRGLIIVLMALDHANYFVAQKHSSGEYWGGSFPVYQDALAFITRFVTHFAAPGFFFLMGVGMLLFADSRRKRGWRVWDIMRHFWVRGGLLIALQLLLINRAWELSPGGWELKIYIGVLFALGGTMILGSLLLWFKPIYLLGLTVTLLIGTELLVPDPSMWMQLDTTRLDGVIQSLLILPGGNLDLWSNYPVIPWLELVVFGILFGHWLLEDSKKAYERALWLGGALILGFTAVRLLNGFGNIRPRAGDSWIGFLNVVKYPPSIAFSFLTMGVNLILLGFFGRVGEKAQRVLQPLVVYGRAPLFFYILHLFLYAGIGILLTSEGTNVAAMYPYWLLGLLILFPLTLWYGALKRRQPANSILGYL